MTSLSAALPRFHRSVLALLVIAALCNTTSCWGAPEPTAEGVALTSDINSQDPAGLYDGGDLRLAIAAIPTTFNPMHADSYADDWTIDQATYPRAFNIGSDGVPVVNTEYFTSIELSSVSPQVVRYTINPNAVWTDGTPITWQDIASQVHAVSGVDPANAVNTTSGFRQVASVTRGVDDRQAVITFNRPYPEWRGMFSGREALLPRSVTATPESFNQGAPDAPSAGPFMVDRVDRAAQHVVLVRNPRWWGRPARLNSITFVGMGPDEQLNALQNGDIDAVRLTSDYDLARAQQIGAAIRHAPEMRWTVLGFNGKPDNVLADLRLREAILQGIDREAILNVLQRGLVDYPVPPSNHFYMEGQQGHRDNVAECECLTATYDPDNARRELDDLGWKLNDDVRQKNGKQLVINDVFPDTRDDWALATLLKDELAYIGVKLNLVNPDGPHFVEGNFDLTQYDIAGDGFPLKGMYDRYATKGMFNGGKVGDADVDAAIEAAVTEPDEHRAQDLANAVDLQLWQEVHSVPVSQSPGFVAARNDLANFGAFGAASVDFTAVGFTK